MSSNLAISQIRIDGDIQPRVKLDQFAIDEYAEAMKDSAKFPPIVVFFDSETHWLSDGFHRVLAAKQASLEAILADVREGTRRDAILFAVGANAEHGARRTNEDKRRAVKKLLVDEEWSEWPINKIAKQCHVSWEFVNKLYLDLSSHGEKIAKKPTKRKVKRETSILDVEYEMDTSNIGKAQDIEPDVREALKDTPVAEDEKQQAKLAKLESDEQKEIAAIIANGEAKNVNDAKKVAKRNRYTESAQDVAIATETYRLICGDFAEVSKQLGDESVDVIVTDPPYAKEYLYLYELLAKEAARLLKQGGSLLAMAGQSYIPDLLNLMTPHLNYQWTIAYLTPGGQSAPMSHRCINTFWKPVFWFVKGKYKGDWRGDVIKSDVNDNDKRFDDWGQSESGIARLVEAFTLPGEVVLDPFVGGGTTAVVCVRLGRQFIGIDIEQGKIDLTLGRLKDG